MLAQISQRRAYKSNRFQNLTPSIAGIGMGCACGTVIDPGSPLNGFTSVELVVPLDGHNMNYTCPETSNTNIQFCSGAGMGYQNGCIDTDSMSIHIPVAV